VLLVFLSATLAVAGDTSTYQKGTVTKKFAAEPDSAAQMYYDLKGENDTYQVKPCAALEDGKTVDFRAKVDSVLVRQEGGKDIKCLMAVVLGQPVSYGKGTIEGFDTRNDYYSSGKTMSYRRAKVYELRGTDLIYKVDYCGAFQAGQFTPGQTVDYRVQGERLYILHDTSKEYSCKIEGTRLPENAKSPGS